MSDPTNSRFYREKAGDGFVTISLPRTEAEDIAYGLADLLNWHRGFLAGTNGSLRSDADPMGVEQARQIKIHIDTAMREKSDD